MRDAMMIGGIRIVECKWLPEPRGEVGYPDWRARLNRNLSRRSTGEWEPLTHPDERPNAVMIGGDFFAHPKVIVALRNLGRSA